MAQYNGKADLPTSSYDAWRNATLGNGYDYDGYYGDQCWDFCQEFWVNIGSSLSTGGTGYAWGCWKNAKEENAGDNFDLITSVSDIKRGDVIVMDATSSNSAGHICFADEDYHGSSINCLGQNQGGASYSAGGSIVSVNSLGLSDFLGAFRYKAWGSGSDTPTNSGRLNSTHNFPWALYARKLRNKRRNVL